MKSIEHDLKEKMIDAAIHLFSKHGYEKTSFRMIAKRCKVSATSPIYYFKTKEGLAEEALKSIVQRNTSIVSDSTKPTDDAVKRLEKYFDGNVRWAQTRPEEVQVILLTYYRACFDPTWSLLYSKILAGARAKILTVLHAGVREGLFRPAGDLAMTAALLHECLLGGIVNGVAQAHAEGNAYADIKRKWELLVNLTLRELNPEKSPRFRRNV